MEDLDNIITNSDEENSERQDSSVSLNQNAHSRQVKPLKQITENPESGKVL